MIEPNGHILFKTALGIETKIRCHVKISGIIKVWYSDNQIAFVPNMSMIKTYIWFKELVKKHGECQGIVQDINEIIIPGEPEPDGKPNW